MLRDVDCYIVAILIRDLSGIYKLTSISTQADRIPSREDLLKWDWGSNFCDGPTRAVELVIPTQCTSA